MRAFTAGLRAAAAAGILAFGVSEAVAAPATSGFHLQEATIADVQAQILAGRLSSTQLVRLYLQRIKAYNGSCVKEPQGLLGPIETIPNAGQINALSTLNLRPAARKQWGFDARKARSLTDPGDSDPQMPDALEVAAQQDASFRKTGKLVGPLHGVVMAIKDQYDTFDMRTTSGADAFYANDRPPDDASFVQRLRDAGAIIIAKANLGEYASAVTRSSFGGTFCNPYDTERSPRGSSAGSGSAVGANLVMCAIAEESGSSIRGPASAASTVGIAATEELVSRDGMVQIGINTRVGPICRTVEDAAKILDVIAGYDPKDELTAFAMGRMPAQPYASYATAKRLDGVRIGVVREYMHKPLFTKADEQTIDLVSRGVEDLRKLGATIVDPGEGDLFTACIHRYGPQDANKVFTEKFPALFPVAADGKPDGDHLTRLLDLKFAPERVPEAFTLRDFGQGDAPGQARYMLNLYLRERGDAAIRSNADLISKARFFDDPHFRSPKLSRESTEKAQEYDMSKRLLTRFAVQQVILQCMAEQKLDALVYPTAGVPPAKLGAPAGPAVNGRRGLDGVWSFLGAQGFPVITVPAGFTTEVYDLIRDPSAPKVEYPPSSGGGGGAPLPGDDHIRLAGPVAAQLPVGMDIVGRPFDEPLLLRIASAYTAATQHRRPPSAFGPLKNEP
ncbi:amidase family protein [Solimonas flava]|uniref:amidase family protein n=1 Tax=Solimonas flava TaxID=415849 RepID=UPI00041F6FE6|nr:amidase family protein [Solimonas flava]